MDVNQINNYNAATTLLNTNSGQSANGGQAQTTTNAIDEAAIYESTVNKKETYKPDYDKIQQMLKESDSKVAAFVTLMEKIFNKQGMTFDSAIERLKSVLSEDGTKLNMEVDEAIRKKAEEELGEDGYWGVDQTATRIMDFAKALSGGDPSKIETLRAAVQKGFKNAEKQWGSELPEISQKTYDEVMKRFDEWAESTSKKEETTTPIL